MRPVLSLLLPIYNYLDGYERILNSVPLELFVDIEVIVGDDSVSSLEAMRLANGGCNLPIQYSHNKPCKGAIYNWNSLIDKATAPFILLMHHDEFPVDSDFWHKLIAHLKKKNAPDVLLLRCLISKNLPFYWRHSSLLSCWLGMRFPKIILRYNMVGPTSCLVVKQTILPKFNLNLCWLVDVDWYISVLVRAKRTNILNLGVISELRPNESITGSLKSNISSIQLKECTALIGKYKIKKLYFVFISGLAIFLRLHDKLLILMRVMR